MTCVSHSLQILNVILRLAWLQSIVRFRFGQMDFQVADFTFAALEVIRRGMWNFFRYVKSVLTEALLRFRVQRSFGSPLTMNFLVLLMPHRIENEHLNNVGKYRATKTVPLPFEDPARDD